MRSLLRNFSFGLICLLLIASSDVAVNVYGYGSGRSPVAAQGVSVVSVNPGGNQTPDPGQGGEAVSSQTNTGHGSTQSSASQAWSRGGGSQTKTCLWHSFSKVSGTKTRVTLKLDWTLNAHVDVFVDDSDTSATASYDFRIEYSLDNGSTWTVGRGANDSVSIPRGAGPGSDGRSIDTSGSESVDLPNPGVIDITQIRVRDRIFASVSLLGAGNGVASSGATTSVSSIRLEVETVNCPASVPTDRWRGEYYNNINLSGIPPTVRDDGAGFLNFNFGDGDPPAGTCGLTADNFSARWTRTVNLGSGVYHFSVSVTGDDGVRLYVGGNLIIDKWFPQGATTYTADVTFSSVGPRQVKLEYFEGGGPGIALLSWADLTGVNCLPDAPLPLISSAPQTGGRENIASTAPSQAPKRCGQKSSD